MMNKIQALSSKLFILGGMWAGMVVSVLATTYPTADTTNFPAGSYDDGTGATPLVYRYFKPVGYNPADTATKYPLVIFCHGDGEIKSPSDPVYNTAQLNGNANGAMIFIASASPNNQAAFPCFWLAPNWSNRNAAQTEGMIIDFMRRFNVDPDRVYITGLSGGGAFTWNMVASYPNRFAASAACCGWGTGNESAHKHIPMWAFHCVDDGTVGVAGSDNAVAALRSAGADPIYTRIDTGGHGGAWSTAYNSGTPLVSWMMAQRRGQSNLSPIFRVSTSSPTTAAAYVSTSTSTAFSGTTEDATALVTGVTWTNLRNNTTGTATGTLPNWDSGTINLMAGSNLLRFKATGRGYTTSTNGSTTFSKTVNVYQGSTDTVAPVVTITSPTSNPTYDNNGSVLLDLGGTASDNLGVAQVSWSNSLGGQGTMTGTTSWQATHINLYVGTNVLTVTAKDAAGNTATDSLTIVVVNHAPLVNAGLDQATPFPYGVALVGTVSDDGLAPGTLNTTLTWSKVSGPGTVTFSSGTSSSTNASFSAAGVYVLRLSANDGDLIGSDDIVVNAATPVLNANLVRFDFGSTASTGNWNNVSTVTVGSKITNAVAANGTATTMGLSVSSAFDNITGQGTTTTTGGVYPTTAIQDGFYTQTYEGATNLGKIKLENLNPALRYNLIFFGSRNDDASGNNRMTTYRVGSTSVRMNSLSNVSNVVSLVNMAPAGDGTIEIQARNDNVGYGYLNVLEVQIVAANTAPVVGAGSNQSITLPATANLSGTVSDDGLPVGGTVTQTWSKFSGPGSVNFGNASALSTTASFSQAGTYVLRLTASDTSLSASSDVTITVAAAGGYSSWQSQQSWNGGNNTEMADPDGDGITNLVEYALGLNPVSAGTTGLPVTNVSGPNVTFTYTKDTSKTDVTYQVQSSPDLGSWTNVTSVRSGPPGTIETWVATVPQDTTKKFLRLQVTK